MNENEISKVVIDRSIKVHNLLGPGLLESVYEEVLAYELTKANLGCRRQVGIPVVYENVRMDIGFRADILVDDKVILELKSVETVLPLHKKQLLTYLRLSGLKLGLLLNFNVKLLKEGITRIVNGL
ncbi:hypothetical protein U27_03196 [Candidatus Vecturithrix granuli]|uniref:GxxExxY protein n=1 Tax=Vecturithrix granuli TaxID=1499967 RepID=A0A081BV79_VECG1|nr:hypothetical protein U27_03196 [Candidatus Vecturithrix granuli]